MASFKVGMTTEKNGRELFLTLINTILSVLYFLSEGGMFRAMSLIADLHLHSKYSRAVSSQMVLSEMAEMAKKKGINLLATGDFTHPLWVKELESQLKEISEGIYGLKEASRAGKQVRFLLGTEISSIYSQGGKGRRIHILVFAPNLETVFKINDRLRQQGCNLLSDGRPIIGLSAIELCELLFSVDEKITVVPAHCLVPETSIHTQSGIRRINAVKVGDWVYTHKNRWKKVERVFSRETKGIIYQVISDYFSLGITATAEHPFYAIKSHKHCASINKNFGICKPTCSQLKKSCARRYFESYRPEWIRAENLQKGDIILFPRFTQTADKFFIEITDYLENYGKIEGGIISSCGSKGKKIPNQIKINQNFCRLIGYYLAEGYATRDLVSFCFNLSERPIINEIKKLFWEIFRINFSREYVRRGYKSVELSFYSRILSEFFRRIFYCGDEKKAHNKCLPGWMLKLPAEKQKEILVSWWQGDKGYTTSRLLMNQMKIICLRLGIIPSIRVDTVEAHMKRGKHNKFERRRIVANHDTYYFSNLSFFGDKFRLLDLPCFSKFKTKIQRRKGWLDREYIYLPIRKITKKNYQGKVYNLEVQGDNSYTTEFALVHNCWTPWFSLYGSKSGFDSLGECFGEHADQVFAVETGLSSEPAMNWRINELDNRSIVSFSDAHSPAKLGRELTVFKGQKDFTYKDFAGALKQKGAWQIACTLEFYPQEGKYHYTGHRNCQISQNPEETKKKGTTCPVCGRPLTVGVMHRVEELSGKEKKEIKVKVRVTETGVKIFSYQNRPAYMMLVPLLEILSEAFKVGVNTAKVEAEYERLISRFDSEFEVLTKVSLSDLETFSSPRLAEAIEKVRAGDIFIEPGYDGLFGKVKIWGEKEEAGKKSKEQMSLF